MRNAYVTLVRKRKIEVVTDLAEDGKPYQISSFCIKYGGRMRKVYFHRGEITRRVIMDTIMNISVL
jgi:hypothetical protein